MKVYLTQDSEADVYTGHGSLQQVCPFMVLESFTASRPLLLQSNTKWQVGSIQDTALCLNF
jgi:hypothetical protein